MTLPPGPPFPPSGPPSGLNFSRCTLATPLPPRPAVTCRVTRSTKAGPATMHSCLGWSASPWDLGVAVGREVQDTRGAPLTQQDAPRGKAVIRLSSLSGRDDVDDATAPLGAELDVAAHQREQGVVATATD